MANIRFIREYKAYDGQGTIYDIVYDSRVRTLYIGEGGDKLPRTAVEYLSVAKCKIQHDQFHGEEKIWEVQYD